MSSLAQPTIAPNSRVMAPTIATASLGGRRGVEDDVAADDEVDPGGDHGRRVDQRRHRCRAGHRVAEPALQRELRRLAAGTEQEQQAERGDRALVGLADARVDRREVDLRRTCQNMIMIATAESEVTDAVGDERLVGRGRVGRVVVPEADEQVRGQTHALPADVEQQVRVGEDEQQHRRDEEVEVGEEAPLVGVVRHVPERVHVDQRPDEGDEHDEGHRQRVDEQARASSWNCPAGSQS